MDGFRVWLEIDGEEVDEYEDKEPDQPPGCIMKMAEVYVVSQAGKVGTRCNPISSRLTETIQEFVVCWSAPPNLDVEGEVLLENIAVTATQMRKSDETRVVREEGAPDPEDDGAFRAFQFQMLTIDSE